MEALRRQLQLLIHNQPMALVTNQPMVVKVMGINQDMANQHMANQHMDNHPINKLVVATVWPWQVQV